MRLDHGLVLNRYFHTLFEARDLTGLKPLLSSHQEGRAADGQNCFYGALLGGYGTWRCGRSWPSMTLA